MLNFQDVARHWGVSVQTVCAKVQSGELHAVRIGRGHRTTWAAVRACETRPETGRLEAETRREAFVPDLVTVVELAAAMRVSRRTVERWIDAGLPTRRIGARIRLNRTEADRWLRATFGVGMDGSEDGSGDSLAQRRDAGNAVGTWA